MKEFIIFALGSASSFASLAFLKTVAEPVATTVGQQTLKKYLLPAYNRLDLEWLPNHYQDGLDSLEDWLVKTCLPEIAQEQNKTLSSKQLQSLSEYILNNFNLQSSLLKHGQVSPDAGGDQT